MEAVIFSGIQAVGKSTFYQQYFFKSHVRIDLDMLRTRHREDILLHACLEARQKFVIDNTNSTVEERARYIHAARAYQFRIAGYYFRSRLDDAKQRNEQRPEAERVPIQGLLGTYGQLQIPTYAEGFDELLYVSIDDDGHFSIQAWDHEI